MYASKGGCVPINFLKKCSEVGDFVVKLFDGNPRRGIGRGLTIPWIDGSHSNGGSEFMRRIALLILIWDKHGWYGTDLNLTGSPFLEKNEPNSAWAQTLHT